jgi:diadenosine tetraphosphate (Ap4A) HIT family hydrolase
MFKLSDRLKNDTVEIGRLDLSMLLLMNDRAIPWFILVPEREGVKEIDELSADDRALLVEEISWASQTIRDLFHPDKINIGALGNLVPQLHVHVIGRFVNDRAWPGPIWGNGPMQPYDSDEMDKVLGRIRNTVNGREK